MSDYFPKDVVDAPKSYEQTTEADPQSRGEGWGGRTTFAGIWIVLVGVLDLIWGVVALTKPEKLNEDALVWTNLGAWGWIFILIAAVQLTVGAGVLARKAWGRAFGVMFAAVGVIIHFFAIPAHPSWAIIALVGNGLVIWALTSDEDYGY